MRCSLTAKRLWNIAESNHRRLEVVKAYQPEVMILQKQEFSAEKEWQAWVRRFYVLAEQNETSDLWVSPRLSPAAVGQSDPRLAQWGL